MYYFLTAGVVMFGIGVGGDVNILELQSIASPAYSEHVFTVSNFNSLSGIVSALSSKTCEGMNNISDFYSIPHIAEISYS
jgi:hypothetical protein